MASQFCAHACQLRRAPAQLRRAPASSGEVVKISREAARSWILGHNVFLWSCKVKIYILGAFGALSPALANRSGKLWQDSGELWQSHTAPSKSHNWPSTRYRPGRVKRSAGRLPYLHYVCYTCSVARVRSSECEEHTCTTSSTYNQLITLSSVDVGGYQ